MKSVFDKDFKYRPAVDTDIRRTFERIRREQLKRLEQAEQDEAERKSKVTKLKGAA